ncbi:MAG: c-type cytochrome [Gammaproteobacteria bacterium]|nr:MAG: c-type cytochrome [Gammaproteobacteria bacterium]
MKHPRELFAVSAATTGALAALIVMALMPATAARAAGSVEAGQTKAVVCTACHGPNGNSVNPEWPSLAGQNQAYFIRTLKAFKSGERSNPLMTAQAMTLSDDDIADLAAYFAAQTRQPKTADPKLAAEGERLFRGGNKETGVAACIACHGPTGSGNAPAAYPSIAGQHAAYTATQLKAYRGGQRSSDLNQMMRNTTARLTDVEIDAIANFVQGLR